jgi:NAD(P)-dependent dehydrogenase (short-subunit alcohol dehydrogenase family)
MSAEDAGMSLEGRRVVVIGAPPESASPWPNSRAQGAAVVIGSSSKTKVDAAVERLPGAAGSTVDLRDEAGIAGFFEETGPFDHLVITAGDWGGQWSVATRDLDLAEARDFFTVRFWGALAAVKHGCRSISKDGSITLTSGIAAHRPRKGAPMSAAVMGVVEALTRALALDLAPVRVNAVCPGYVLTDIIKGMPEEMLRAAVGHLPVPRAGSPAEAAKAYVYLMLNGYATGQILPVDGGRLVI